MKYENLTKAQLAEMLEEANQRIEDQKIEIEQKDIKLGELTAHGEGWLVQTTNPAYEGQTMGIQFVQGQAFIRKNQRVPFCEIKPMKETTAKKLGYTPEEVEKIREREAMSEAERAIEKLEKDFGYTVIAFDGSESADKQMEKIISQRAREYTAALEKAEAARKASEIVAPGYMGG